MLHVLDLFSGIGGFSLGLERTGGFRTIAFCEIDAYARRVLRRHWPDVPVYDDVRSIGLADLLADGLPRPDVVCGGFPCQDISFAGQGAGLAGARSGLWFQMHRVIDETRPRYAIIENVAALRSRGLDTVLGSLAAIGYDAEWHCIPAAAVGAPHRRDRVWIVSYPNGESWNQRRPDNAAEESRRRDADRSGIGVYVADARRTHGHGRSHEQRISDDISRLRNEAPDNAERCGQMVCDADRAGLAIWQSQSGDARPKLTTIKRADWWIAESDVGRVANGISSRVDRLRCLGNSIVPQIAEQIGRAILDDLAA